MSLKHTEGKVIVEVNMQYKNWHTLQGGETIRVERQYNEFDRRLTEPVNGIVISAENIPSGTEILIDHNSTHDTYKINSYVSEDSELQYYSVPVDQCYVYRDSEIWKAIPPYETALRVFKPYEGEIVGLEPKKIKDVLFVTSGKYEGLVVKTLVACDYCVVFQDINGREGNIIRFLPNGNPLMGKETEAIAIMNEMTEKVKDGSLLVGLTISDCKKFHDSH